MGDDTYVAVTNTSNSEESPDEIEELPDEDEESCESDKNIIMSFHNIECTEFIPAFDYSMNPSLIHRPCRCGEYSSQHRKLDDIKDRIQTTEVDKKLQVTMAKFNPPKSYGHMSFIAQEFPTRKYASASEKI